PLPERPLCDRFSGTSRAPRTRSRSRLASLRRGLEFIDPSDVRIRAASARSFFVIASEATRSPGSVGSQGMIALRVGADSHILPAPLEALAQLSEQETLNL